jgi:hypothetical protein
MGEIKPDNIGTKNEVMNEELANLLKEFLELELTELRLEQENRKLKAEELMLHEEQYGDDADIACYDFFFELDNC